jgi:hypothetical protein
VPLDPPYDILDMADGQSMTLRITAFKLGEVEIHPKYPGAPTSKIVRALRVWIPHEIRPEGMPYLDITSQTLIAQLEPELRDPNFMSKTFKLTAVGVAPKKRYILEV